MDGKDVIYDCNCPEWDECPMDVYGDDEAECYGCKYGSPRQKTV